jgi:hypothetical protein
MTRSQKLASFVEHHSFVSCLEPKCRVPTTRGTHNQRFKKNKTATHKQDEPKWQTRRLDYVPTHTRHARQDASTTFRLARGSLDKAPRLSKNLQLARPWVGPLDPPYSPTLRQKSEHLMRPPTTSYHHGYSSNRCGSSTGVKSHFFTAHPRMGGENLSLYAPYHALFRH